jgi:hypothetical protein
VAWLLEECAMANRLSSAVVTAARFQLTLWRLLQAVLDSACQVGCDGACFVAIAVSDHGACGSGTGEEHGRKGCTEPRCVISTQARIRPKQGRRQAQPAIRLHADLTDARVSSV